MPIDAHTVPAPGLAGVAHWFKSSHSDNGTACVEAADLTRTTYNAVAVRDSKDPDGPALLLAPGQFAALIADVRAGRYDI